MGAEMNEREALKLALEALEFYYDLYKEKVDANAITAIKEALAQPEQEPVTLQINSIPPFKNPPNDVIDAAFHVSNWAQRNNWTKWRIGKCCSVDYTTPPQRKPLPPQSPCEMTQAEGKMFKLGWLECEAAHGIKGE